MKRVAEFIEKNRDHLLEYLVYAPLVGILFIAAIYFFLSKLAENGWC